MKRTRRVGVPGNQKLFLTPKMQKVTAVQRWTKKAIYIEKIFQKYITRVDPDPHQ